MDRDAQAQTQVKALGRANRVPVDENTDVYVQKQAVVNEPTHTSAAANGAKIAKRVALQTVTNTAQGIYRQYSKIGKAAQQQQQHAEKHAVVSESHVDGPRKAEIVGHRSKENPAAESTADLVDPHSSAAGFDDDVNIESDDTIEESIGSMDLDYSSMEQQIIIDDDEDVEDADSSDSEVPMHSSPDSWGKLAKSPRLEYTTEMRLASGMRKLHLRELLRMPSSRTNPHALFPVDDTESQISLAEAAEEVAATPGILDDKDEDWFDVGMVCEYGTEIFSHMRKRELALLPNPNYMDSQREITWQLRSVLVDWLVQIHHRFNLLPETLFLTINYIDRFMSVKHVSLSKFQLVGAVALFLAAKYEEINYLSVQEVTAMVENQYSAAEITKAERYMVDLLEFNLGYPGPMSFLRRASKADDYDLESRTLAKYLMEITIMDERFVAAPPSWTAAVAYGFSRMMLQRGEWTPRHTYFAGYTEKQLMPGIKALRDQIESPTENHNAIYEKYSERKFRKAALFVRDWVLRSH